MKKVKVFSLSLLTLFLMFFILISIGGVDVSAYTYNPDEDGEDFTPYKNNIVHTKLEQGWMSLREDGTVLVTILEEGLGIYYEQFQFYKYTDFSPEIVPRLVGANPVQYLKDFFNVNKLYWNPWAEYWQIEYPVEPEEVDGNAADWFNHISQFDYGIACSEIFFNGSVFGLLIVEEPSGELAGCKFEYDYYSDEDWIYFKPNLRYLKTLIMDGEFVDGEDILESLEQNFGQDFDGYLYWNFEEQYWQIDYYNKSEFNKKEVDMVTDLLETLAEIGAGIGDLFGKIVESVGQFFYTPGTGDTPGSFTIIGILTIAAVVVSLSMWVLRLILRLFKLRG